MLPTGRESSIRVLAYGAEVGGRLAGAAEVPNILTVEQREAVRASGERIMTQARALGTAVTTGLIFSIIDHRFTSGRGVLLDRSWDRTAVAVSDRARNAVPDRNTTHPDFLAIFEDGTTARFTKPTVKQDDGLASELRGKVERSGLSTRDEMLALIDTVLPLVEPAARAARNSEEQLRTLTTSEIAARQALVEVLWAEQRTVEATLGRGSRELVRLFFFDFSKSRSSGSAEESELPETTPTEPGTPSDG